MEVWLIILIVIAVILFVIFLIPLFVINHIFNKKFNRRYENNPNINYYKFEEFGLNKKIIEIPFKKEVLRGYLVEGNNYDKNKIIVYCHGFDSSIDAYVQDMSYIALKGYQVIGINYIGTETSTGKIGGMHQSLASTDIVINYIKNSDEFKNKDIYVIGHSWGSFAASNIVKYHKDIKGFVALATYKSNEVVLDYNGHVLSFLYPYFSIVQFLHSRKYSNDNFLKSTKNYKGRGLVIHSTNDPVINYERNFIYLKNHNKNKNIEFITVEDRLHNPEYTKESAVLYQDFVNNMRKLKTEEERINYMKTINFHKLGEIDSVIMDKVVDFIG